MKQVLQSLKTGETNITDIPSPQLKTGQLLIRTHLTLISPGTEKMLVEFGKASFIDKARQQPDKVRMVFDKIKTDGLLPTVDAVLTKLDQRLPMGYCNVGTVIAVGHGVDEFKVGDRVVSNGAHAEIVAVAKNLCCRIPESVTDEQAVFAILGAIALQGIRLAQPTLGEAFVVMGLGLIGLLTVQLLRANGCRVLAIDLDANKTALASAFGAETLLLSAGQDPLAAAQHFSRYRGVDGVIITASTQSSEPVHQAAHMCRKRGRLILVGVTGLELSRADFYEKELSFQVSCSYGPGRYDASYEEQGQDYPVGFVRWTEQRNFEAFLDMLASHAVSVNALITHQFPLAQADQAYALLSDGEHALGIVLYYEKQAAVADHAQTHTISLATVAKDKQSSVCLGVIGAGNYASRVLIPAFKKTGADMKQIACSRGISGAQAGKKFGFAQATTDTQQIFSDADINTVVIASRHNNHADFVCQALQAGKHVFVEKPLCLTLQELANIERQLQQSSSLLMVGFNRRFAPQIQKISELLRECHEPKSFIMTVNAGDIPKDHWTQDQAIGGGRLIGEACHFIDLLRFLAAAPITSCQLTTLDKVAVCEDKASITLTFADGSFGVIHYLANGHRSFPKERLEIFTMGRILQLDNFRKLRAYGWPGFKRMHLWRQDKGQATCVQQFTHAISQGLPSPIPVQELLEVSRITLTLAKTYS